MAPRSNVIVDKDLKMVSRAAGDSNDGDDTRNERVDGSKTDDGSDADDRR